MRLEPVEERFGAGRAARRQRKLERRRKAREEGVLPATHLPRPTMKRAATTWRELKDRLYGKRRRAMERRRAFIESFTAQLEQRRREQKAEHGRKSQGR